MKSDAQVSVIIPCYNAEKEIDKTLQCIRNQTEPPLEILVVDDGSTDRTREIVQQYSEVTYFYQPNRGPSAARNFGLQKAKGEWIAFCDSDDYWYPAKLERQTELVSARPEIDFVVANGISINTCEGEVKRFPTVGFRAGGDRVQPIEMGDWIQHGGIYPSAVLARRDLLLRHKGFDESSYYFEDFILWSDLVYHSKGLFLNEMLYDRNIRPESLSHGHSKEQRAAHIKYFKIAMGRYPEYYASLLDRYIRSLYMLARMELSDTNYEGAKKSLSEAIRLKPLLGRCFFEPGDSAFLKMRKVVGPYFMWILLNLPPIFSCKITKMFGIGLKSSDPMKAW